ncbi:hypothetical protein [Micromonospora sp. NPDC051141]|uniref:hypothetical protein n=1 Tax=Micromonospora sp. NPDC051141 TaxID=3364284 RepID=UPI0037B69E35
MADLPSASHRLIRCAARLQPGPNAANSKRGHPAAIVSSVIVDDTDDVEVSAAQGRVGVMALTLTASLRLAAGRPTA